MMRGQADMTADTVKKAFNSASKVVFVCDAQKALYGNPANSIVIYTGIAEPNMLIEDSVISASKNSIKPLYIHANCNWMPGTLTHSLTHSLTQSITHSLTHSLNQSLTYSSKKR